MENSDTTFSSLVRSIKEEYHCFGFLQRLLAPEDEPLWNISDISTNLAFVKPTCEGDPKVSWQDMYVRSADSISGTREPTTLPQLFSRQTPDGGRRVWIMGAAGCGKSTIAQRIAFDWSNGSDNCPFVLPTSNSPFQLIIWIKLRHLAKSLVSFRISGDLIRNKRSKRVMYDQTLGLYLVQNFKSISEDIYPEDIASCLTEFKDKTLFILDGYDEIVTFKSPAEEEHKKKADSDCITEMFHFLTRFPNVMVTTRPSYDVPRSSEFQKVELLGFLPEDCTNYITRHFSLHSDEPSQQGCAKLMELLESHPKMKGIVRIPVNLEILCRLLTADQSGRISRLDLSAVTQTDLYFAMVKFLLLRAQTREEIPGLDSDIVALKDFETNGSLFVLGSLALRGLIFRQMTFSDQDVKVLLAEVGALDVSFSQSLLEKGFLRGFTWSENKKNFTGEGEFLHLTLQEFFAAWFLVHTLSTNKKFVVDPASPSLGLFDLLKEANYKFSPSFVMTWPFVSGLLRIFGLETQLNEFADRLANQSPYDCYGEFIFTMVIRCAEESLPRLMPPAWDEFLRDMLSIPEHKYFEFPTDVRSALEGSGYVLQYFEKDMELAHIKWNLHSECWFDEDPFPEDLSDIENPPLIRENLYSSSARINPTDLFGSETIEELCRYLNDLPKTSRGDILLSAVQECFPQDPTTEELESKTILGLTRMNILPLKYFTEDLLKKLVLFSRSSSEPVKRLATRRLVGFREEAEDFKLLIFTLEKLLQSPNHDEIIAGARAIRIILADFPIPPLYSETIVDRFISILQNPTLRPAWLYILTSLRRFPSNLTSKENLWNVLLDLVIDSPLVLVRKHASLALFTCKTLKNQCSEAFLRRFVPIYQNHLPSSKDEYIEALVGHISESRAFALPELFKFFYDVLASSDCAMDDRYVDCNTQDYDIYCPEYFRLQTLVKMSLHISSEELEEYYNKLRNNDPSLSSNGRIIWKSILISRFSAKTLPEPFHDRITQDFLLKFSETPVAMLEKLECWGLKIVNFPRLINSVAGQLVSTQDWDLKKAMIEKLTMPEIFVSSDGATFPDKPNQISQDVYESLELILDAFADCLLFEGEQQEEFHTRTCHHIFSLFNQLFAAERTAIGTIKEAIVKLLERFKSFGRNQKISSILKQHSWPKSSEFTPPPVTTKLVLFAGCASADEITSSIIEAIHENDYSRDFSPVGWLLESLFLTNPELGFKEACGFLTQGKAKYDYVIDNDLLSVFLKYVLNLIPFYEGHCFRESGVFCCNIMITETNSGFTLHLGNHLNVFSTLPFVFDRATVKCFLYNSNNWRTKKELPVLKNITKPIDTSNLKIPPFSDHNSFVQYFLDSTTERPFLKDFALNYISQISRMDELSSLSCWFDCGDPDVDQLLLKQLSAHLSVSDQVNFAGEMKDSLQIQLLGKLVDLLLEEEMIKGILNSEESIKVLLNANSLVDAMIVNGVVLNSEFRFKIKQSVDKMQFNLEAHSGVIPYHYFLVLRLYFGVNALSVAQTRLSKKQRQKTELMLKAAKIAFNSLTGLFNRLGNLGFGLFARGIQKNVSLGPMLFAFGGSIYSCLLQDSQAAGPVRDLLAYQSQVKFTPLSGIRAEIRDSVIESDEVPWDILGDIVCSVIETAQKDPNPSLPAARLRLCTDLMGIVHFITEVRLRTAFTEDNTILALFWLIYTSFPFKCVRALILHHQTVLSKAGLNVSIEKPKLRFNLTLSRKPSGYKQYLLSIQNQLSPEDLIAFETEHGDSMDSFKEYHEERVAFDQLYAEFFSSPVLTPVSEQHSDPVFSSFSTIWFAVFGNDNLIYRAMILLGQFSATNSIDTAKSIETLLNQASAGLHLPSTSDWGRDTFAAVSACMARPQFN